MLACEATLNIANATDILDLMREADFTTIFCGIETPEPEALQAMAKDHNMVVPICEAVRPLNAYGMEVVVGHHPGAGHRHARNAGAHDRFIEDIADPDAHDQPAAGPAAYAALGPPRARKPVDSDETRESNVVFKRAYEDVLADWRQCLAYAYEPARLFGRYAHQSRATRLNRIPRVVTPANVTGADIRRGLAMLLLIIWKMGVLADYRRVFWRFAWPRLKAGDIEEVIAVCLVSRHLIAFSRKACAGN